MKLFLLSACLLLNLSLSAQWTQNQAIEGAHTEDVLRAGTTFYAAHRSGVYTSVNEGLSWSVSHPSFLSLNLHSTSNSVFASNGSDVIRTQDGGLTWDTLSLPNGMSGTLTVLRDTLYLLQSSFISPDLLYRSGDEGTTWTLFTSIPDSNPGYGIVAANNRIYFTSDTLKVLQGTTLQNLPTLGLPSGFNLMDEVTGLGGTSILARVIVSMNQTSSVYRFNGTIWTQASLGLNSSQKVEQVLQAEDSLLFLTGKDTVYQLYISDNDGLDWTPVTAAGIRLDQTGVYEVAKTSNGHLLVGSDALYHTSDLGQVFIRRASGMHKLPYGDLSSNGSTLVVSIPSNGLFWSDNRGASWLGISETFPVGSYNDIIQAGKTLYFFTSDPINWLAPMSAYRSEDKGLTWATMTVPLNDLFTLHFQADTTLFLFRNAGNGIPSPFYRSDNHGVTWQSLTSNLPVYGVYDLWSTQGFAANATKMYMLGNDGYKGIKCYRSDDRGMSWTSDVTGLSGTVNFGDAIYEANGSFYIRQGVSGGKDVLYRHTGTSWQVLSGAGLPAMAIYMLYGSNNHLFASTPKGVYISTDGGDNWIELNDGFNGTPFVRGMAMVGDTLFSGNHYDGIWMHASIAAGVTDLSVAGSNVFPNPADVQATLRYTYPETGTGELAVYALTGALMEERKIVYSSANSEQDISIETADYPEGMYTYRLVFPDRAVCGKLLVVHGK